MAQVEIVKFAAFYNEGLRGMTGGAAKNDKVWGLARVQGKLFSFWGRRNGKLKTKRYYSEFEALSMYEEKIGARKSGDIYTAIVPGSAMQRSLFPSLVAAVDRAVGF